MMSSPRPEPLVLFWMKPVAIVNIAVPQRIAMDTEERRLYAEAVLGKDAEQFFQTELGQYVLGRSMQESEEVTAELKVTAPEDTNKVRELQNQIQVCEKTLIWLNQAIIEGKQAKAQLELKDEQGE